MEDQTQQYQKLLDACLAALDHDLEELNKDRDALKKKAQDLKSTHRE
jgi:cell division protein FtsB